MSAMDRIPFLDFDGNYQLLPGEKEGVCSSQGSFSSIQFNEDLSGLDKSARKAYNRVFGSNQDVASHIRSTFSSNSLVSSHGLQSIGKASSTQVDARRLFCCIKERNLFQITCHTNTNYELSGYGREIRIKYCQDDLLLMGYSVALLDFLYRNNKEEKVSEGDYLPIVLQANNATSDEEFNRVLQDRASLETMIVWFKNMLDPKASYNFDKQSLPAIQRLFERVRLPIDIAKQKTQSLFCFRAEPGVGNILQNINSSGELVMRGNNLASYFSG